MRRPGPHSARFIGLACLAADRDEHILRTLRGAKKEGPAMDKDSMLFVGLDLGDRWCHLAVLDQEGQMLEESRVPTTPEALRRRFSTGVHPRRHPASPCDCALPRDLLHPSNPPRNIWRGRERPAPYAPTNELDYQANLLQRVHVRKFHQHWPHLQLTTD